MATIQIRKKSNKVWIHVPSDIQEFIISKFYASIDGLEFQVVEQGQSRRNKYLLGNITVHDDTSSGTAETFSTIEELMLRLEALKYPAFFNEGESLIEAFTDLTDKFDYGHHSKQMNWPPVWHFAAQNDRLLGHPSDVKAFIAETAPQARFTLLSKTNGYKQDYDHISMLTHPMAVQEHFVELKEWLLLL
jgi:hypothetical protein